MNATAAIADVDIADPDALDFAGLLCSRLCHDLLSPIGALGNGLELLAGETDPEMRQGCFELLEQSAQASSAKLRFYRLAFGGSGAAQRVAAAEARAAVDGLAACGRRIAVSWSIGDDPLPRPVAKTMLNLALIGIDALIRGGTLEIGVEALDGTHEIVVRACGERLAFDPMIGRALDGELAGDELTSRTAPSAMVRRLALAAGGTLQYVLDDQALVLGAVLPAG
jgi:histidine phosphotransferase ChpT